MSGVESGIAVSVRSCIEHKMQNRIKEYIDAALTLPGGPNCLRRRIKQFDDVRILLSFGAVLERKDQVKGTDQR